MNYPRALLDSLYDGKEQHKDYKSIVQSLVDKIYANEELSLAEERFACGIFESLRDINGDKVNDIKKYTSCSNYLFRGKYLLYVNDLNGHKAVIDFNGEIPLAKKKEDVAFLQNEYENWKIFLEDKLNGFKLINYVAQETRQQLKQLEKFCQNMQIGSRYKDYLHKTIVLHGKYIYLLVKEFYQELGKSEEIIEISGREILVDAFTYVHTMFRHYASHIKQHQIGKSYHFDTNIGFKEVPNFLIDVLTCFKNEISLEHFNSRNIFFQFNEKPYALWFRPFRIDLPGGKRKNYLRVQTFYPIEDLEELKKLDSAIILDTNCNFKFFILQKSQ